MIRNENASIILTTHLISEVENMLDRVVYIDNGHIKFNTDMEYILEQENNLVEYIESQFAKRGTNEILYPDD